MGSEQQCISVRVEALRCNRPCVVVKECPVAFRLRDQLSDTPTNPLSWCLPRRPSRRPEVTVRASEGGQDRYRETAGAE